MNDGPIAVLGLFDMVVAGEDCVLEESEGTKVTANTGETEKRRQNGE
jgi:hypothetical protein